MLLLAQKELEALSKFYFYDVQKGKVYMTCMSPKV